MAQQSEIRISCASLCRIIEDDKYLVLLNKNRRGKGVYQLSPVGGAIEIHDWKTIDSLNITYRKEKDNQDLRLFIDRNDLETFRQWFLTRSGRERTPFRELKEELVDEAQALIDLKPQDVGMRFAEIREASRETLRTGLTGQFTYYFFEIFDISFKALDKLLRLKSSPQTNGIVWLDEDIARKGGTLSMEFDDESRQVTVNTEFLFPPKTY